MAERFSSKMLLLLKLFVGVVILVLVLRHINLSAVSGVKIEAKWLILAFLIGLLIILLKALRWRSVLANYFSHEMSLKDALPILFIGQLFGFATPSTVGDLIRANYVKESLGLKRGALSVALETLMDLMVMLILSVCALALFSDDILSSLEGQFSVSRGVLFIGVGVVIAAVAAALALMGTAKRKGDQLKEGLRKLCSSFSLRVLAYQMGLTILMWMLAASLTYACVVSLGLRVSFIPFLLIVMLQSVLVLIPFTVLGLGIREGSSVILYPLVGIPADLAVPIAWLAVFFVSVVPALIGALAYAFYRGTVRGNN